MAWKRAKGVKGRTPSIAHVRAIGDERRKKMLAPSRADHPAAAGDIPRRARSYYGGTDSAEKAFTAWMQAGNLRGALRLLRTQDEFATMSENTMRSLFKEHREEWLRRRDEIQKAVEEKTKDDVASTIARLESEAHVIQLKGLVELAKVSAKMLPKALHRLAEEIEEGELKSADLAYSLPKLVKELTVALKPSRVGSAAGLSINDNRRVTINLPTVTRPQNDAQAKARRELTCDLERKAREVEKNAI